MGWMVIGIALATIVLTVSFIGLRHFKHRVLAITVIILLLLIYLSFSGVARHYEIQIDGPAGLFQATKAYFSWIGHAFTNFKELTGDAVNLFFSSNVTQKVKNLSQGITSEVMKV